MSKAAATPAIADTSAWARASDPAGRDGWTDALLGERIATCPITLMGLLYSTRNGAEFAELEADLARLDSAPLTAAALDRAVGAMRELSARGTHHRVPLPDVLVAACAAEAGLDVLHYDRHFDRLAEVLPFGSRWIAPAGTLD
jgi:predicted nucleic acid-binding protein